MLFSGCSSSDQTTHTSLVVRHYFDGLKGEKVKDFSVGV